MAAKWAIRSGRRLAFWVGMSIFLTSCMVGPDYVKPSVIAPAAYKEIDGWKVAQPQDDVMRGAWWVIFHDPQLSALEERVDISNQNVIAAEARFQQARALVREARASYFRTGNRQLAPHSLVHHTSRRALPHQRGQSAAIHCRLISPGN